MWVYLLGVDVCRLSTNDVLAALNFYGVEAARALFLKELRAVFSAYGIHVQTTHLGLVADFVTREGIITPFNRQDISLVFFSPRQRPQGREGDSL